MYEGKYLINMQVGPPLHESRAATGGQHFGSGNLKLLCTAKMYRVPN